jgi:hypothetical protein
MASRTSLSRSLSATTVLSLLSTSIFGCAGAPLGSRYAKMKSPFFGSFSLTEMPAHRTMFADNWLEEKSDAFQLAAQRGFEVVSLLTSSRDLPI